MEGGEDEQVVEEECEAEGVKNPTGEEDITET